ncbi:MAG TPA: hypothetical protein GXZ43_06135 [Clostridiaceae bacterium]|nr:hypothetical protein [Clostridiaceae bacterium]
MDKIDKIIEVILSEAQAKADQILQRADHEIVRKRSETKVEIEKINLLTDQTIKSEQETMQIRTESLIETGLRQKRLEQRQCLIEEVIDLALLKFSSQSNQEKIKLYSDLIQAKGIKSGEISLNKAEQDLLEPLLTKLGSEFSAGAIADISGGLIVKHDRIEENLSLDLIIRDNRAKLSVIVANNLFPEI